MPSALDTGKSVEKGDNKAAESLVVNIESVRDVEKAATPPARPRNHTRHFLLLARSSLLLSSPWLVSSHLFVAPLILFEDVFHSSSKVINATISVYSAIFAVTPLFGAPASDYLGRKGVYLVTMAIFLVANTLLAALPPTIGGLFVLRIFQALGASVATSVGAGTVADVTPPAMRASRMGIFLLGPNLGPVLGPLIGGQFSTLHLWRWVFGFLSIAAFPVFLLVLFFLPETLRSLVGNGSYFTSSPGWLVKPRLRQKRIVPEGAYPKPPRLTPKRLVELLFFVPNLIVSVGSGLQFSGLYCIYITFPRVWQQRYGWSGSETGYAFLVPAVFLLISSLLVGRVSDMMYRRYKAKNEGKAPPPEKRIDIQIWGYLFGAAGKAMFGWFVFKSYHPVAPLAASAVASVGTGLVMVTSTAYQSECQPSATASLVAIAGLLRNIGSAIAAAIIDSLLRSLGLGWLFTGLALLDAVWIGAIAYIRVRGHTYRKS
ncbi:hypothetical protein RRF57_002756 [Xylaria bambusicola]|uniref:Major facilitator superfamily (MFS) profile domain-containing protein n=1 Tax=Xylaria bambusicola TaxID=326684 RepID=A0AAN7UFR2_9PEZI